MNDQSLTDFVSEVCTESHLRVETDLGDGFVRLLSEEAERRQAAHDIRSTEDALIEMLRNSRDAHARLIFVCSSKSENTRTMVVIDDGDGVPAHHHETIFEPRVTSKLDSMHFDKWGVHGRGMALYSIKVNAEEASVTASAPHKGCAISTRFNTSSLSEKTDQSTFPVFTVGEKSAVSVRGPKNLMRTAAEFAFEHRDGVSVYFGSASEIAATLYSYGSATLSLVDRTFASSTEDIPLVKRLSLAADEETFVEISHELGLEMSTRTARRILDGTIKALPSLFELIQASILTQLEERTKQQPAKPSQASKKVGKRAAAKISKDDLQAFQHAVERSFTDIAEAYYLSENVNAHATVTRDELVVRIPLIPQE